MQWVKCQHNIVSVRNGSKSAVTSHSRDSVDSSSAAAASGLFSKTISVCEKAKLNNDYVADDIRVHRPIPVMRVTTTEATHVERMPEIYKLLTIRPTLLADYITFTVDFGLLLLTII